MARILLLLTLLSNGRATSAPDGDDPTFSAVRRGARAARRRPKTAGEAYETWTRARIDGPNFERFADFAGACMRGHDACRPPSDQGQCEDASAWLRVGEAHEVTAPQLKMPSFPLVFQATALF